MGCSYVGTYVILAVHWAVFFFQVCQNRPSPQTPDPLFFITARLHPTLGLWYITANCVLSPPPPPKGDNRTLAALDNIPVTSSGNSPSYQYGGRDWVAIIFVSNKIYFTVSGEWPFNQSLEFCSSLLRGSCKHLLIYHCLSICACHWCGRQYWRRGPLTCLDYLHSFSCCTTDDLKCSLDYLHSFSCCTTHDLKCSSSLELHCYTSYFCICHLNCFYNVVCIKLMVYALWCILCWHSSFDTDVPISHNSG